MEIDLVKIFAYSQDCFQDRARMKALMMDLYPGKTRDMNLLLSVYDSGVPEQIKKEGKINRVQYVYYVKRIVNDFGLNEIFVKDALNAWIDICLGPGTADSLNIDSIDMPGSEKRSNLQEISQNNMCGTSSISKLLYGYSGNGQIAPFTPTDYQRGSYDQSNVQKSAYENPGNGQIAPSSPADYQRESHYQSNVQKPVYGYSSNGQIALSSPTDYQSGSYYQPNVQRPEYRNSGNGHIAPSSPTDYQSGSYYQPNVQKPVYGNSGNGQIAPSSPTDYQSGSYYKPNVQKPVYGYYSEIGHNIIPTPPTNYQSGSYTQSSVQKSLYVDNSLIVNQVSDYELSDILYGTVVISSYLGFDQTNIEIPAEISGKKVIGIGNNAFRQCKGLRRLKIPEGIEFICRGAFADCSNLESVTLPSTLEYLGSFDEEKLSELGDSFYSMICRGNERFPELKGVFEGTAINDIYLPNSVKILSDFCFSSCHKLRSIHLSERIKSIGAAAFFGDWELSEIRIPNSVRIIGRNAFSVCSMLSTVILNEGLKTIRKEAFSGCSNLREITIPSTVDTFGEDIFKKTNGEKLNITIRCYPGSKAIDYARKNNLQITNALAK